MLLVVHKVLAAPPVLIIATNMLFCAVICGLLADLLWSSHRRRVNVEDETLAARSLDTHSRLAAPGRNVGRAGAGYSGFATFLAERMLSTLAVLGTLYILLILTHSLFVERLGAGTARGRALAANFGVSPRRLGLLASLISGGICLFLILGALVLIVGPGEMSAAGDFLGTVRGIAFGFRIGEFSISFSRNFCGCVLAAGRIAHHARAAEVARTPPPAAHRARTEPAAVDRRHRRLCGRDRRDRDRA